MTDKDAEALHALAELFREWHAHRNARGTVVILAVGDDRFERRPLAQPEPAAVYRFPKGERLR